MKRQIIMVVAVAGLIGGTASSASAAPGADIRQSCNASFGQLISGPRSSGMAVHGNYAGGAAAFADPAILAAHGCTG